MFQMISIFYTGIFAEQSFSTVSGKIMFCFREALENNTDYFLIAYHSNTYINMAKRVFPPNIKLCTYGLKIILQSIWEVHMYQGF